MEPEDSHWNFLLACLLASSNLFLLLHSNFDLLLVWFGLSSSSIHGTETCSEFLGPMARRGAVAIAIANSRSTGQQSVNAQQPYHHHHSRRSSRTSKHTVLRQQQQHVPCNLNSYHSAHEGSRNHQNYRHHRSHLTKRKPAPPQHVLPPSPPPFLQQYRYVKKEFLAYSPSPPQRSSPPPMPVVFCSNNNKASNYGERDDESVSELSYNHSKQQQKQCQHDQQHQSYWEGRDDEICRLQQQSMGFLQPDSCKVRSGDDTHRMLSRKNRKELLNRLMRDTEKPAPPPEDDFAVLPSDEMFRFPPVEELLENRTDAAVDSFVVQPSDEMFRIPPVEERFEDQQQKAARPTRKQSRLERENHENAAEDDFIVLPSDEMFRLPSPVEDHFDVNYSVPYQEQPGRHVAKLHHQPTEIRRSVRESDLTSPNRRISQRGLHYHWFQPPKSPPLFHEQIQLRSEYQQCPLDGDGGATYPCIGRYSFGAPSPSAVVHRPAASKREKKPVGAQSRALHEDDVFFQGLDHPSVDNDYDFVREDGKWW